jgi:hypothetical protein
MLLSDAQSTGLRDLRLCHWVVNVGELSSGAPEINRNLCPSRVATHDQRDDYCTEPTVDELQPDGQFDCGKAPQCAFVERLSTSRGGSAIGCCPVASLLACWASS